MSRRERGRERGNVSGREREQGNVSRRERASLDVSGGGYETKRERERERAGSDVYPLLSLRVDQKGATLEPVTPTMSMLNASIESVGGAGGGDH